MRKLLKLSAIFLEHASVRVEVPEDPNEFEALLLQAYQVARDAWPGVVISAEEFVRHLAQRLPKDFEGLPLAQVLGKLLLPDGYLACACLLGIPEALKAFEDRHMANLLALLRRSNLPEDVLRELLQKLRIQVLFRTDNSRPDLDKYMGLGTLGSWLTIVANRLVSKEKALAGAAREDDALMMLEALPAPDDPHFDTLKRRYFPELSQAVGEALNALSPEQRHLLRLHFRDRLSTTKIARLLGVNQSTIWRQIAKALEAAYAEMKRRLQERHDFSTRDFESLVRGLLSQIDLSISQLLREKDSEGDDGKEKDKGEEDEEKV